MFWDNPIPLAGWISIFWAIIIIGVLFGTLGYAEEEFWTVSIRTEEACSGTDQVSLPSRSP